MTPAAARRSQAIRWRGVGPRWALVVVALAALSAGGVIARAEPSADELRMFPEDVDGAALAPSDAPAVSERAVPAAAERAAAPLRSARGHEPLMRHANGAGRSAASAGDGAPRESTSWVRTSAALAGVVALIVLLGWGYRTAAGAATRWPLALRARNHGVLELVARMPVAPRQSVCLLRVGPRLVLLGVGGDGLRALDVIEDADATAKLVAQARGGAPESGADFQRALLAEARREALHEARVEGRLEEPIDSRSDALATGQRAAAAPNVAAVRNRLLGTIDRVRARHARV